VTAASLLNESSCLQTRKLTCRRRKHVKAALQITGL
jgi:hypothetical protein